MNTKLTKNYWRRTAAEWERRGERYTLKLFRNAADRVPAYKDFLKKNKINPSKITRVEHLENLPPVNKKNYLSQYPLEKLVWDGNLKCPTVFSATSGSTGEPFYFPRDKGLSANSSVYHELFLRNVVKSGESVLVIVGFGMGAWIGGVITYQAFNILGERGYPVSIITPGPNKKEILETFRKIAGKFDAVILCGYPPFLKDILDEGEADGINWKDYNLKIIFAAESFSEEFRTYILNKIGVPSSASSTTNIYGTADLGTMAMETPLSIRIRRALLKEPALYGKIFSEAGRLPTLAQFNPEAIRFDASGGEILCTADSVLPLIRYEIGDRGGVTRFTEMEGSFRNIGIKFPSAQTAGIEPKWPFVFVYERSDLSVKLYGAIIYPEHIREVLAHPSFSSLTGKFTIITEHDKFHNEHMDIHIELKKGILPKVKLQDQLQIAIIKNLLTRNAEYNYLHGLMPARVKPKITLWKHEHPAYFGPAGKQKWVKKISVPSI